MEAPRRITVIGTGLLGASLGLGLRRAGWRGRCVGVGRPGGSLDRALAAGHIDQAVPLDELPGALAEPGLVVLAAPLGAFADLFTRIAPHQHPGLAITDAGSTKQSVCDQASRTLTDPTRFIGAHPMAGGEQHGPEHARADLFEGRPCVLTPPPDADPEALARVTWLWRTLGMRPITMTPQDHDRHVARVSHVPHAAAVALVELAQRGGLDVASTGFRDTTRVASADPTVWRDIFSANRAAVAEELAEFESLIASLRAAIVGGTDDATAERLAQAKRARDAWLAGSGDHDRQGGLG